MSDEHPDQRIVLARHAETEWSLSGQHTGSTDLPLTETGRATAGLIGRRLRRERFDTVLTSPLKRAAETCRLAGYGDVAEVRDELREWDYGDYEGATTAEVREERLGWILWRDGAPGGETPAEVERRVDRLVDELRDLCEGGGDTLVFSHGHLLRALAVRWVGLPIDAGRLLRLSTGTVSTLGWKRELRVIDVWNDGSHLQEAR